ncbi:hypothetical protein Cgig2_030374 [Carnegiea gigantea]|uniref:Pectinesterase inhibitor domain-containing protein n=1 Tax=Carnegiea gigantea TaxID=171969 RepID=A0A9Q1KKN2_9CARY|nr:hypothetical protein Cgig2_030374 [Carnegiea gigantea]
MRKFEGYFFSLMFSIFMIFQCSTLTNAAANNLVLDTCKKMAGSDPNIKYNSCVTLLGSDPRSSKATSLSELGTISFEIDISKAKSILSTINGLLKDPKFDPNVKRALKDCSDFYSTAPDNLQEGLDALKAGDYSTANIRTSAAFDSSVNCDDSFKEKKASQFRLSEPAKVKEVL